MKELEIRATAFYYAERESTGFFGNSRLGPGHDKEREQDPGNRKETTGVVAWKAPWAKQKGILPGK